VPQFAAMMWKVKPGNEERLAELFANYARPDSFVMHNEQGAEVGKVLATVVFFKEDTIVRVIQFDGDISDVMRHMGRQKGVRDLEDAVDPYLVVPRDLTTQHGFREFFEASSMRLLVQRFADDYIAA
jgi:hypothetical protein